MDPVADTRDVSTLASARKKKSWTWSNGRAERLEENSSDLYVACASKTALHETKLRRVCFYLVGSESQQTFTEL